MSFYRRAAVRGDRPSASRGTEGSNPSPSPAGSRSPMGPMGPPTLFTIPVLRFMKICGLTHEQLAMVSVVQREWAAKKRRNQLGGVQK